MLTRLQRYAIFPTAANLFCKESGKRFKSPCPPVRFCTTGKLIIPEGVTTIAASALWDCRGLTSVTIPASVTDIG
ncbi:MAG: hypothetical protein IJV55_06380 [Paludibacteraceae bacterium]|nr:hypothetical protein [Paludibacteraceae bacterium]